MEIDYEELFKVLNLQNKDSDYQNEQVNSYILHLASCGFEKLEREIPRLLDEKAMHHDQTLELVTTNYKTFIHTAECTKDIYSQFGSVEDSLSNLESDLPKLKYNVEEFLHSNKSLSSSRQTTSIILSKHTQLLEILELPQLMETCVRNGYYDDALDILSYVKKLEKKHSDIPIIQSIVNDIKGVSRLMLSQLYGQLRTSITLPQCLKIVGILRRLGVNNESELRLKFLQARDTWFTNIIKAIPKDDAYHHITKVVEASRVHLFDIVTQYRAIFSDEDTRFSVNDDEINQPSIFYGWILHKVNQFISILEIDLSRGIGSYMESLLSQCMFFGQSFSRVGADFRNLLIKVFEKAVFAQVESDIKLANSKFDESLRTFSLLDSTHRSSATFLDSEIQEENGPPLSIMEFSPLAHYINNVSHAFNNLRLCCPLTLVNKVVDLLITSLTEVVKALLELHRIEHAGFTKTEEEGFGRMCDVLCNALFPHMNKCLLTLFPLKMVSDVTGISVKQLEREEFGQLKRQLLKELHHFIPKQDDSSEIQFDSTTMQLQEAENSKKFNLDIVSSPESFVENSEQVQEE